MKPGTLVRLVRVGPSEYNYALKVGDIGLTFNPDYRSVYLWVRFLRMGVELPMFESQLEEITDEQL